MFGYVTANYKELSTQDRVQYKAHYCGLCRALSARYGAPARWLVSFDTAFLFLILNSLECSAQECRSCRCPYHFGQKRQCIQGEIADYCADVTVLLAYLNIEDDVADSKSLIPKLARTMFRSAFAKAKSRHPELCASIKDKLHELSFAETRGENDPYIVADIFGQLLEQVFAYNPKAESFGYMLGRAIYLLDAASDFEGDIRRGRYNPLVSCRVSEFDSIVGLALGECAVQYEKLDLFQNREIADNVIYSGIRLKYELKKKLRGR